MMAGDLPEGATWLEPRPGVAQNLHMAYYRVPPPLALCGLVESFSLWEGGGPSAGRMAVMATRTMSLQIDLHDDELCWYEGDHVVHALKGVTVAGPQSRPFAVDAWQPRIVRVVIKSSGARSLLNVSPGELRDTQVSLEDIWGRGAARLQHRLADAKGPGEIFRILGEALTAIASREHPRRPAVAEALAIASEQPGITVSELARRTELSPKRLIRLFTAETGLTPKLFLRIARFERLLAAVYDEPSVDWASTAAEHGYFDQSHLIRDFRDFTGLTPTEYLVRRGPTHHHARA
jgi:AraC-like DNA-binding protein